MKRCGCCKEEWPLDHFSMAKNKRGEPVPHTYCKPCRATMAKSRDRRNPNKRNREYTGAGWPVPAMGLGESLECIRLKKWAREYATRLPVYGGGFGAAVIGATA